MKVRLPRSWDRLPPKEKEIINEVMTEEVVKQVCHEQAELQKIWLKMACIVLHRNFGFGRKRCMLFLANWREMYRQNSRLEGKEDQERFLSEEIDKIFRKEGYPTEYVDKLENL